ncbi:hypothetical protein BDV25DRAFT_158766, partial [Aspergillus avenaceus]
FKWHVFSFFIFLDLRPHLNHAAGETLNQSVTGNSWGNIWSDVSVSDRISDTPCVYVCLVSSSWHRQPKAILCNKQGYPWTLVHIAMGHTCPTKTTPLQVV